MTYLIGVSGPPRSGKDTLATALRVWFDIRGVSAQIITLSLPMRHAVYGMMGLPYTLEHYEKHKDTRQVMFGGLSIRQAMIALSEQHVKPSYGQRFWAEACLNQAERGRRVLIVNDMGFDIEREVFEETYGWTNCMWPQLYRPGHTFIGDSRNYVGNTPRVVLLDNAAAHGLEFFPVAAQRIADIAEHWGWKFS